MIWSTFWGTWTDFKARQDCSRPPPQILKIQKMSKTCPSTELPAWKAHSPHVLLELNLLQIVEVSCCPSKEPFCKECFSTSSTTCPYMVQLRTSLTFCKLKKPSSLTLFTASHGQHTIPPQGPLPTFLLCFSPPFVLGKRQN